MNQAWECPRCGRMNAPFNPSCFCKKDNDSALEKMIKDPKAKQQVPPIPMYPEHGWLGTKCFDCGGDHILGMSCGKSTPLATLHARE